MTDDILYYLLKHKALAEVIMAIQKSVLSNDIISTFDFDVNKFCEYVRVYMNCSCLTEYDLEYMPYAFSKSR